MKTIKDKIKHLITDLGIMLIISRAPPCAIYFHGKMILQSKDHFIQWDGL